MKANFYPGPSRVYSNVPIYLLEAYSEGIMSVNHRSDAFMSLVEKTKNVLKEKLNIPSDYQIIFTSSATECWEIISQSLTEQSSHHFYNGAFGEKWMKYAGNLTDVSGLEFGINEQLPLDQIPSADLFCLTQNETSNGTQVSMDILGELRNATDGLIAVDATSSMAGIHLDFELADIWYASVQKCFGLPAGNGLMILSPKAIKRAEEINDRKRYNSLLFALENWNKNQSPYTPNVMGIYLLYRTMEFRKSIEEIGQKMQTRGKEWQMFFDESNRVQCLIENEKVRSDTVLTLKTKNPSTLIQEAAEAGITFGKGYGKWKESTFRIANFPAIKKKEIAFAKDFLQPFL